MGRTKFLKVVKRVELHPIKKGKLNQKEKLETFNILRKAGLNLKIDGLMSEMKEEMCIDVIHFDKHIPNYDSVKCTYKGKPNYSTAMAVEEEFGKGTMELVKQLL